jgi:flavin reductase (DIM6/NTAB) family NADH-FMN oxidoreductase RutF
MDAQKFKQVMSHWLTGIVVITTADEDRMVGFTANSFASMSIDPMLVVITLGKTLSSLTVFQEAEYFAVNMLSKEQADLGKVFAGMIPERNTDRFAGLDVMHTSHGAPLLPDTLAWMECRVYQRIDVGASILYLGEVQDAGWSEGAEPLAYYQRQWGEFVGME